MLFLKIAQEFILPSVFVFILIFIGALLFWKQRTKTGAVLFCCGIAAYYLFSITPVADFFLAPLEKQYVQVSFNQLSQANTIVLLLGGFQNDIVRASEALRIYIQKAKENKAAATIIISGTDSLGRASTEGLEVKQFLVDRGVEANDIVLEQASRTTRENALFASALVGGKPFFLVTSAYHMPRAFEEFRKLKASLIPAPAGIQSKKNYSVFDFFPHAGNLASSDIAFHEFFGILFYRLIGK